jgi:hypothetical protein
VMGVGNCVLLVCYAAIDRFGAAMNLRCIEGQGASKAKVWCVKRAGSRAPSNLVEGGVSTGPWAAPASGWTVHLDKL